MIMNSQTVKKYVFYCTNGLEQDQAAEIGRGLEGVMLKTIELPCSGKIDIPYLVKAFETGADGAVIVTCKKGQCKHLEGNLRAQKRAEAVESLLEEIGMDKGCMAVIMLKDDGAEGAIREIRNFIERIKEKTAGRIEESTII
jgi:coenzyme F420-reducing hydrogenase delta subunit